MLRNTGKGLSFVLYLFYNIWGRLRDRHFVRIPLTNARQPEFIDFFDSKGGPMGRFFTALGLSAVWGFLGLQQGLCAPQSPRPIAVGSALDADPLVWRPPAEIAAAKVPAKDEMTGSIGNERSVVHGAAAIDAAAFEKLRVEVSTLRRTIDAMPAAVHENRPPDYARTLGGIVKTIQGVEKRLAVVEGRRVSRSSVLGSSASRP